MPRNWEKIIQTILQNTHIFHKKMDPRLIFRFVIFCNKLGLFFFFKKQKQI